MRAAGKSDVAVNSLSGDAAAAASDACGVTTAFVIFIDRNVRQVGSYASIHATRIKIGIHIRAELQLDIAVDPAQRHAILIELLQTNYDASVDALQLCLSRGACDLDSAVDACDFNRTLNLSAGNLSIHALSEK